MQSTELLFQTLFDQMAEPRIVVSPDAPAFTIVAANKAYKAATGDTEEELVGRSIWQLFKADIASTNARTIFEDGLNNAMRHRTEFKLPIFRFDLPASATEKAKPRWWQVDISPVTGAEDEVVYLMCTTRNLTLHVEAHAAILKSEQENAALLIRQQEQTEAAQRSLVRNAEISDSEYRLNRIVEATPAGLSIIKGRNLIIETVNDPLLQLWGRKKETVIGQQLLSVFPELQDQPFLNLLDQVFNTANSLRLNRQSAVIIRPNGDTHTVFVDFRFDPLFDAAHQVDAVLVTVNEITEIVKTQQLLQDREEELEVMNEELMASNEELTAINEELLKLKDR